MKSWLLFSFLCLFSKAPCKVEQTQGSSGKMAWILEAKNRAFCPSLSNLVTHRRWAQWLFRAHWNHHRSVLWLQENMFSVEVSKHHLFLWCLHSLFSMRPAIYSSWKNLKFMKKRLSSHLPGHPILPSSWRSAACSVFPSSEVRRNFTLGKLDTSVPYFHLFSPPEAELVFHCKMPDFCSPGVSPHRLCKALLLSQLLNGWCGKVINNVFGEGTPYQSHG